MNDIRILTSGRLADEFYDLIKTEYPTIEVIKSDRNEVSELLPQVNAIAGFNFLSGQDLSHIKWIHSFGAGVDSFLSLELPEDTILTRTTGDMGIRIGEFCLAYLLAEIKSLFEIKQNQDQGIWEQQSTLDLNRLNVLILGTGSIGQGVAKVLKPLANTVNGVNTSNKSFEVFDKVHSWDSIKNPDDVDAVINTLPATEVTDSIVDGKFLSQFQNIIFINVGRGETVNDQELLDSISRGHVSKAILDVFRTEPLPKNSPFWQNHRIITSPHQSGITSIEDVQESFRLAYTAIEKGEKNHLFVDRAKGY